MRVIFSSNIQMNIPFTVTQFLEVFKVYNLSVWPMQTVLYILGIAAIYLSLKKTSNSNKIIIVILSFYWLWTGVAYHLMHFTAINKAAYVFGTAYIIQGVLFLFAGVVRNKLFFHYKSDTYGILGALFICFAMVIYPVLGYIFGHVYPYSPTFGLPCPLTIFTFGLLLWTEGKLPLFIIVIPFLWSVIGFSAALAMGIYEDIGLLIAGVVASSMIVVRNHRNIR
jgi:hypothetical protein